MFLMGLVIGIIVGIGGLLTPLFISAHESPKLQDSKFETWCKEELPLLSDNEHEAVSTAIVQLMNLGLLKSPPDLRLPAELVSRKSHRISDKGVNDE